VRAGKRKKEKKCVLNFRGAEEMKIFAPDLISSFGFSKTGPGANSGEAFCLFCKCHQELLFSPIKMHAEGTTKIVYYIRSHARVDKTCLDT
jgi:hypothetical protein